MANLSWIYNKIPLVNRDNMKDSFKFDLQFVMDVVHSWTFYLTASMLLHI